MQKRTPSFAAFTLIEILVVASIGMVLLGLSVPALNGLKGNQLDHASVLVMNLLYNARTEAISEHTMTRFAVSTNWEDAPSANYRKASIWKCVDVGDPTLDSNWKQVSAWQEIPVGVVFDPNFDTAYAGSPSGINAANYLFAPTNSFSCKVAGKSVDMKYAEFLPTGGARVPTATGSSFWMTLREGVISDDAVQAGSVRKAGKSANWATIKAYTLTGRLKVLRP